MTAQVETTPLLELIAELDDDQRLRLAELLAKPGIPVKEIAGSVVPFVHSWLRADYGGDFSVYENAATLTSPPVTLDFADLPQTVLPPPAATLDLTLGEAIEKRCSRHHAEADELTLEELSTFLRWTSGVRKYTAAYNHRDFPIRMTPSAGGLQPIDVYLVANSVQGLDQGLYYYQPDGHRLQQTDRGNLRRKVSQACIYTEWIGYSAAVFVMVVDLDRVHWKYGDRGYRFAHVDAGLLAESMYLVSTALGWNVCAVAAFYDDAVNKLVDVDGRNRFATLLFAASHPPAHSVLTGYRDE